MSDFELPEDPTPTKATRDASRKAKAKAEVKAEPVADESVAEEKVEGPQYDPEELIQIFDTIMFEGEYTEVTTIRGKLKVTFRSRSTKETLEISKKLDGMTFNLYATLEQTRALFNLGCSLISYNGRDLSKVKYEDRIDFIQSIPTSVTAVVSNALAKFDAKVDAACREGEENF